MTSIMLLLMVYSHCISCQITSREQYDALVSALVTLQCDNETCPMPAFNTTCPTFARCDAAAGDIISINLSVLGLRGECPVELSRIPSLEEILLQQNHLKSKLPSEWALLSRLTYLALFNNDFQMASLPTQWARLSSVTELDLQRCNLMSTLPTQWSSLTNLNTLFLEYNNLVGEIPTEWASIPFETFSISHNYLRGSVPDWAANATVCNAVRGNDDTNCFVSCPSNDYVTCCAYVSDTCTFAIIPSTTSQSSLQSTTLTTAAASTTTTASTAVTTTTARSSTLEHVTNSFIAMTLSTTTTTTTTTTVVDSIISADMVESASSSLSESMQWLLVLLTIGMFLVAILLVIDAIRRHRLMRSVIVSA